MKKILMWILIVLCLFSISIPAMALSDEPEADVAMPSSAPGAVANAEPETYDVPRSEFDELSEDAETPRLADGAVGRGTIDAPDKFWATNGYPENISFAYEAGGESLNDGTSIAYWEIGIIDASADSKQEVIDLLAPNCRITFRKCDYSYRQREIAYNEIRAIDDEAVGAVQMLLNSEVVLVEIADGYEKEYAQRFIEQYGAFIVVVNNISAAEDAMTAGGRLDKGAPENTQLWLFITIFLAATVLILFLNRTRLIPAMQTARGTIVTQRTTMSFKETVDVIRNSEATPNDELFDAILGRIEGNK